MRWQFIRVCLSLSKFIKYHKYIRLRAVRGRGSHGAVVRSAADGGQADRQRGREVELTETISQSDGSEIPPRLCSSPSAQLSPPSPQCCPGISPLPQMPTD